MTYRLVEGQYDESGGEALTICCPQMEGVQDLELEELEGVAVECVQYHCEAIILRPDKLGQEPWKVR